MVWLARNKGAHKTNNMSSVDRESLRWFLVAWVNDGVRSASPVLCVLGNQRSGFGRAAKHALRTHNIHQDNEGKCFYESASSIRLLGNKTTRPHMRNMTSFLGAPHGSVIYFYKTQGACENADVEYAIRTWKRTYTKSLKEAVKAFFKYQRPCGGARATRLTIKVVGLDKLGGARTSSSSPSSPNTLANAFLPAQSVSAITALATPSPTPHHTAHTMVAIDCFAGQDDAVTPESNIQAWPPSHTSTKCTPPSAAEDVPLGDTTFTVEKDAPLGDTTFTVEKDEQGVGTNASTKFTPPSAAEDDLLGATTFTVEEDEQGAGTPSASEEDAQVASSGHVDVHSCSVTAKVAPNEPQKAVKPSETSSDTANISNTGATLGRLGEDLLFSTSRETSAGKACHTKSTLVRKPTKRKLQLMQAAVDLANAMTESAVRQQQVDQLEKTLQDAKKAHVEAENLVKELTHQLIY